MPYLFSKIAIGLGSLLLAGLATFSLLSQANPQNLPSQANAPINQAATPTGLPEDFLRSDSDIRLIKKNLIVEGDIFTRGNLQVSKQITTEDQRIKIDSASRQVLFDADVTIGGSPEQLTVRGDLIVNGSTTLGSVASSTVSIIGDNVFFRSFIPTLIPRDKLFIGGNSIVVAKLAADPTIVSSTNGQIYYNTTTNKLRAFENGQWIDLVSQFQPSITNFQDTHNIYLLALQSFFDNKIIPVHDLIFDGFSDDSKVDKSRSTGIIDSSIRKFRMKIGDKSSFMFSNLSRFQDEKSTVRLWLTRNFTTRQNLLSPIVQGATSLQIGGHVANRFSDGNIIDIYDKHNIIRERKAVVGTPIENITDVVIFEDDFNRPNSTIVGNNWFEVEIPNTNIGATASAEISENRLRLVMGGSGGLKFGAALVHRNITAQNDILITGNYSIAHSRNIGMSGDIQVLVRSDGTINNGFGMQIEILGDRPQVRIVENGVTKASKDVSFKTAPLAGRVNFELRIAVDNSIEVRVWNDDESKPVFPTVSFGSFLPVSTGTKLLISNRVAGTVDSDALIDDIRVVDLTPPTPPLTMINFNPPIELVNGFDTSAFMERVDVIPQISLVKLGIVENFQNLDYVRSIMDNSDGALATQVEDEYQKVLLPGVDVIIKMTLTREDLLLEPFLQRYGVSFR